MARPKQDDQEECMRLASRLAFLWEDPTDPERSTLERLALVRDRVRRMREIRKEVKAIQEKK